MDALETFEGRWRMTRLIEDARAARRMCLAGEARFEPDGAGLLYAERGVWRSGDLAGAEAHRSHLWRPEGARIAVLFADGRPFHVFDAVARGRAEAAHDCPPDLYRASYLFALPDTWEVTWRATGPRKDYLSRTRYRRIAPPSGRG